MKDGVIDSPVKKYKYSELKTMLKILLPMGYSVLVTGSPGVGKSTLAREVAGELGFADEDFIDLRPAQMDPVEFAGMYVPNRRTKTVELFKPYWVPTDRKAFIFLDEINAAITKLHQAVMYQIVHDKRIGPHKFAEGTIVMAAGNLPEDNAIVTELSAALNNRFAHFILKPDVDEWLVWAESNGIPADYRAYIAFGGPSALYNNDGSPAFPSPRSNAAAGQICAAIKDIVPDEQRRAVSAFIGEGAASAYYRFKKIYANIKLKDILEKGNIPDFSSGATAEPSFIYALMYACATYIADMTDSGFSAIAENVLALVNALASKQEYQVIFMKLLLTKNPRLFEILQRHAKATEVIPKLAKHLVAASQI